MAGTETAGGLPKLPERLPHFYRKSGGGYVRPVFTRDWIEKLAALVPAFDGEGGRSYGLALLLLEFTFGHDWLCKHVLDEPRQGFLARSLGTEYGTSLVMHRVRDLAELVVNLMAVRGVESPLDQIAAGNIDSGYAELQVGRLLHNAGVPFRFIWPSGKKRESFDVELVFKSGAIGCADTKNKLETKDFSEKGIRDILDQGRKQLPENFPGVIFVKIPHHWYSDADVMQEAASACREFLRGTGRVVLVFLFSAFLIELDGVLHDWMQGTEYRNPKNRFGTEDQWRLLTHTSGKIPTPTNWLRLVDLVKPLGK